ncbi:unnamed protein product, partial [Polarella glacialis]
MQLQRWMQQALLGSRGLKWTLLPGLFFLVAFCCVCLYRAHMAAGWVSSSGERVVIVGDVHGCADELLALLKKIGMDSQSDRLVFLGDLVGKGPKPRRVLEVAQQYQALAVQGNHEYGLLQWRARGAPLPDPLGKISEHYAATVAELGVEDWEWLAARPYFLKLSDLGPKESYLPTETADMPERGTGNLSAYLAEARRAPDMVLLVHAGLVPGAPPERQEAENMVHLRTIDPKSLRPSASGSGGLPWAQLWRGPELVIFGHDARRGLQQEPFALGLDTGAVYGGALTALVLPDWRLVS